MNYSGGNLRALYRTTSRDGTRLLISSIIHALQKNNERDLTWTSLLQQVNDQPVFLSGTAGGDMIGWDSTGRALLVGDNVEVLQQYVKDTLGFNPKHVYYLKNPGKKLAVLQALSTIAKETRQGDTLIVYFGELTTADQNEMFFSRKETTKEQDHENPVVGEFDGWSLRESDLLLCLSNQQGNTTVLFETPLDSKCCFSSFPVQLVSQYSAWDAGLESAQDLADMLLAASTEMSPRLEDVPSRNTRSKSRKANKRWSLTASLMMDDKHYGIRPLVNAVVGPTKAFCHAYSSSSNTNIRDLVMGMRTWINHTGTASEAPAPYFASSRPIDAFDQLNLSTGHAKRGLLISIDTDGEEMQATYTFLLDSLGYLALDVIVLKDGECTRESILKAMTQLQQDSKSGDQAFVLFQGAGSHAFLSTSDDSRVYSEEIFEALIYSMPENVRVTMLFDGAAPLRLPYSILSDDYEAVIYVPAIVVSIRLDGTNDLLAKLERPPFEQTSWPDLADSLQAVVTSSRCLSRNELIPFVEPASRQKRALMIGASQDRDDEHSKKLSRFKLHLQQFHGFVDSDVCCLYGAELTSRSNILCQFESMVEDSREGDNLVVYYCDSSHHHLQEHPIEQKHHNSAAVMVPSDCDTAGSITGDDVLHFVKKLPEGVQLTFVLDTSRETNLPLLYYYSGVPAAEVNESVAEVTDELISSKMLDPSDRRRSSVVGMLQWAYSETMGSLAEEASFSSLTLPERSF